MLYYVGYGVMGNYVGYLWVVLVIILCIIFMCLLLYVVIRIIIMVMDIIIEWCYFDINCCFLWIGYI